MPRGWRIDFRLFRTRLHGTRSWPRHAGLEVGEEARVEL